MYHSRHHTLRSMYYSRRHLYNDLDILHRFHLTRTFHSCRLKKNQQDFLYFLKHFCQSIRHKPFHGSNICTKKTYIHNKTQKMKLSQFWALLASPFPIYLTKNLIFCLFLFIPPLDMYKQMSVNHIHVHILYTITLYDFKRKTPN